MGTSDGIIEEDWSAVADLAEEIVNATGLDLDPTFSKKRLVAFLDVLEGKYGRLPSILSTKADYIDDCEVKLSLLKEAYVGACEISDSKNKVFICGSLLELYMSNLDKAKANYWLERLREGLLDHPDDYFQKLYMDISAEL